MNNKADSNGYDAAISSRAHDHLNRWSIAKELFGAAVDAPQGWSVRIGLYGEWGTGKTSVLNFIDTMAREDGHFVVWFNPWEFRDKESLWTSFVTSIYNTVELESGRLDEGDIVRRNSWLQRTAKFLGMAAPILNKGAAPVAEAGVDYVKKRFSIGAADLKKLELVLGTKRIIVLIDDLDRTTPELVPEMLFVLREIMDLPKFSFVCAFDPTVVGKVLENHHRGFDDGLQFLDKIIDYPRWLPPIESVELELLAVTESKQHTPFVPIEVIKKTVQLLPKNPRSIKQFIRLLALIKPQIERHYTSEIRWPMILTANSLKIHYPKIAYPLLWDDSFWNDLSDQFRISSRNQDESKIRDALHLQIDTVSKKECVALREADVGIVAEHLRIILDDSITWLGSDVDQIVYQTRISERPLAVTKREYDAFFADWNNDPTAIHLNHWLKEHRELTGCDFGTIFNELLMSTLRKYQSEKELGDSVFFEENKGSHMSIIVSISNLLRQLIIDIGSADPECGLIDETHVKLVFHSLEKFSESKSAISGRFWESDRTLICDMVDCNTADLSKLLEVFDPLAWHSEVEYKNAEQLRIELCNKLFARLAVSILSKFEEFDYIKNVSIPRSNRTFERFVILNVEGAIWRGNRTKILAILDRAESRREIQENAYNLLRWFVYLIEKEADRGEASQALKILNDKELLNSIWNAAVASPLGPRWIYPISNLDKILKNIGSSVQRPPWWPTKATTEPTL